MEHCQESQVGEAEACRHLHPFTLIAATEQPSSYADGLSGSTCWRLDTPEGPILYAVRMDGLVLWVTVAAGRTSAPAVGHLARALERRGRALGAVEIGFQTARRGLVRVARRYGYRILKRHPQGWELQKVLHGESKHELG